MNILTITWKDLLLFVKDRGRLLMAFLLPLVFILAFGYAYTALSASSVRVPELAVVNLDGEGLMAQELLDRLTPENGVQVKPYDQAEAQDLLEKGDLPRVLTIPAGFSQAVAAGQRVVLELVNRPEANESDTLALQAVIAGVSGDLSLQTQLVAAFRRMGQMQGGDPQSAQAWESEVIVKQAQSQFERARSAPLVSAEKQVPAEILRQRAEEPNSMEIAIPGFAVLFLFLSASATALSIFSEKKLGTFRRLLTAPLYKAELLPAKMLPNLILVLLQAVVIFAVGAWLMPLLGLQRISLSNLPALAVVSIVVGLSSTSLGVLLAALCRTEGQIGGVGSGVLWVAGGIAGAFIPQFLLGDLLGTIGKITPHYWAISAYSDIIVRGANLAGVSQQLGVLVLFTLAFFAIGVWRFKFDA